MIDVKLKIVKEKMSDTETTYYASIESMPDEPQYVSVITESYASHKCASARGKEIVEFLGYNIVEIEGEIG